MWNAEAALCMQVFSGHMGPVLAGLFSADGKTVCTGSDDGTVFVYNPKTGKAIHHFKGTISLHHSHSRSHCLSLVLIDLASLPPLPRRG